MVPKTIHLCWFSNNHYPIEIKRCLLSWRRLMPEYNIRRWTYEDARAIGCPYIDEALAKKKWAFAADVVRFYAIWKEGGIYMDSDIYLYKSLERLIPEQGCATFHEMQFPWQPWLKLQAACLMGEAGNDYCRRVVDNYMHRHFLRPDGSMDLTISPLIMVEEALPLGLVKEDRLQRLDGLTVYPTWYLLPNNRYPRVWSSFGRHTVRGSWRQRKLGRRFEKYIKRLHLKFYYHVEYVVRRLLLCFRRH